MSDPAHSGTPPVWLSLCMATMNRGAVIGETLASLAAQTDLDGWELVVIDGSSDDATGRVIDAWRDRLPPIRYERCAPRGFDRDYCAAVDRAQGEYCWLVADDDPVRPGAIAAIRRAVADRPDFVVLNGEVRGPDLREQLTATSLPLDTDRVFHPGEDDALAAVALSFLSYVGSVVVNRGLWKARAKEPYWGTDFVHVGVLMQRPIERSVVVLAQPHVVLRFGVALWTNRFFDIWMLQWPRLIWSIPQLTEATKQSVAWREPSRRLQQLLLLRATGHYGLHHYRNRIATSGSGTRHRLVARLIAGLPVKFAARLARIYFRSNGRYSGRLAWEIEQVLASDR